MIYIYRNVKASCEIGVEGQTRATSDEYRKILFEIFKDKRILTNRLIELSIWKEYTHQ